MQEIALLESKQLREQAINRIEVLEKVKHLLLIPNTDFMIIKQVADYYEVETETIKTVYYRNKDEINSDGVDFKSNKDFSKFHFETLKSEKGKITFRVNDEITIVIPTRGILCFSKRAILRIGMLLRDSPIAKEIRTQILNTVEAATPEQRTQAIEIEEGLQKELMQAVMNGNLEAECQAKTKIIAFQNRHINELNNKNEELKENNKALAGEILEWNDREKLNRAVRVIANIRNVPYGYVWKELYDELRYKHHIGLSQRGDSPYIQHIKEDEWPLCQQSLSAICENSGISPSRVINKAKYLNNDLRKAK